MSKTFMFLNLAGHAISFYLDATGRKGLQRLANKHLDQTAGHLQSSMGQKDLCLSVVSFPSL